MNTPPLRPSVEFPVGPRNVSGVPNWARERHADAAVGAFGGVPYGATERVRGLPQWARVRHADAAAEAS
eukprot:4428184-Pyramimonas_sp.AAC.1